MEGPAVLRCEAKTWLQESRAWSGDSPIRTNESLFIQRKEFSVRPLPAAWFLHKRVDERLVNSALNKFLAHAWGRAALD